MSRLIVALTLFIAGAAVPMAQDVGLPNKADSLKFAIIGDSLYSGSGEKDYRKKFEEPYKPLLDGGVKFYAALGNHDNTNEKMYKPFNMNGERFYTFKPKPGFRIFALDSNYMDRSQLDWLEKELAASGSDWKVVFFHHPLYSSGGTHGSDEELRAQLEPLFLKYGVDVVLSGHEHFYERIKPQKGIQYFIVGSSAKVRPGDLQTSELTAKGWDQGYGFMLVEISGDELFFQEISDKGETIDAGSLRRAGKTEPNPGRSTQPVEQAPAAPKQPIAR
jgi:predicted phosphodiesterase